MTLDIVRWGLLYMWSKSYLNRISADALVTDRSDISWHCKSYVTENADSSGVCPDFHKSLLLSPPSQNVNCVIPLPTKCMMNRLMLFHTTRLHSTFPEHYNKSALTSTRYTWSLFLSNHTRNNNSAQVIFCTPIQLLWFSSCLHPLILSSWGCHTSGAAPCLQLDAKVFTSVVRSQLISSFVLVAKTHPRVHVVFRISKV